MKMKRSVTLCGSKTAAVVCLAVLGVLLPACNLLGPADAGGQGELRISFARDQEALTRSGFNIPDTSDFILNVKDSDGKAVYEGSYGACPESLSLPSGSYTVSVISEEFEKPAFSRPQFGDEQCVVVPSGGSINARLVCSQTNAGIRLVVDPGFLFTYPDGVLILKSSTGRIVYGYSEKRVAYFKPGDVSLVLNQGVKDQVLMTRTLNAKEVLELKVGVSGSTGGTESAAGSMSIQVDTARTWLKGEYIIGGEIPGGADVSAALTVTDARNSVGSESVWVSGYIVGGDLSSSSASFKKPFSSRTNLLIGPRSTASDRNSCMSVQLPSGELRDALNLVDHPSLLGRKVYLRGDIVEAYYGLPGIKNITEYELW